MWHKQYVYLHRSPDGRIVYCGRGVEGRAWSITKRHPGHRKELLSYDHDYVEIVDSGLTVEEATLVERRIIREEDPMWNDKERIR